MTLRAGLGRACLATALALAAAGAAEAQTTEYQAIFADGFESGDVTAWDAVADTGGNLTVSNNAALTGTWGLEALVDDQDGLYVQDDSPASDSYYSASFQFDPNNFDPGETQNRFRTRIFIGFEETPNRRLFAVVLRRIGGQYSLMGRARRDDDTQANTGFVNITDDVHQIALSWRRSSTADAQDGTFEMSIDGVPAPALSGLDNNISGLDFARMGALSVKLGATGTMYWDTFSSQRNLTLARAQLVINEVDYDQSPTADTTEFIEIYNPGPAPAVMTGSGVLLINGVDPPGFPSLVGNIPLGIVGTFPAGQYIVIGPPGLPVAPGTIFVPFTGPGGGLQNQVPDGPRDGILFGHATTCQVIDRVTYEGSFLPLIFGPCGAVSLTEGTELSLADIDTVPASLVRDPNGTDTDDNNADFKLTSAPTPGAANAVSPF